MDVMLGSRSFVSCGFLLLSFCAMSTLALRCKCTKESETVSCEDGVCEIDNGSCLMLDHPKMGQHYTCHAAGLKDEHCYDRISKSNVTVRICACRSPDFCNYSYWPDRKARDPPKENSASERRASAAYTSLILTTAAFAIIHLFVSLHSS